MYDREAALSTTEGTTTESEPEVVPGSGKVKEDKRPRKVPQMKKSWNKRCVFFYFEE